MSLTPIIEPGANAEASIAERIEKLRAAGKVDPEPVFEPYVESTNAWRAQACGAPMRYGGHSLANWDESLGGPFPITDWRGDKREGDPWCVLVLGKPGRGKTHVATALFEETLKHWRHLRGWWLGWPRAIEVLKEEMGIEISGRMSMHDKLRDTRLVLLDDIGATRETEFSVEALRSVVLHRYENLLPTIITSNAESVGAFAAIDERIASRLQESRIVRLGGIDKRGKR